MSKPNQKAGLVDIRCLPPTKKSCREERKRHMQDLREITGEIAELNWKIKTLAVAKTNPLKPDDPRLVIYKDPCEQIELIVDCEMTNALFLVRLIKAGERLLVWSETADLFMNLEDFCDCCELDTELIDVACEMYDPETEKMGLLAWLVRKCKLENDLTFGEEGLLRLSVELYLENKRCGYCIL